jgi:hypothetical protein
MEDNNIEVDIDDLTQLINTLDKYMDLANENYNYDGDFEYDTHFVQEMREKYDV